MFTLTGLLTEGFSSLASVFIKLGLSNGIKYIKDEFGIDIDAEMITGEKPFPPDVRAKLKTLDKQYEAERLQREDEYRTLRLKNETELIKLGYENTNSARRMQETALKSDSKTAKEFIYAFAIISIIGLLLIVGGIFFFISQYELNDTAKQLATIIISSIFPVLTMIFQYFFGSSMGSKQKTNILNDELISTRNRRLRAGRESEEDGLF